MVSTIPYQFSVSYYNIVIPRKYKENLKLELKQIVNDMIAEAINSIDTECRKTIKLIRFIQNSI